MRMRFARLSLIGLACACLCICVIGCTSANPRPAPATPPPQAPPTAAPPAGMQPMTPPPARPVTSDPGVRTLPQPAIGGLVAETEPDAPTGTVPATARSGPDPFAPAPRPPTDDGLGAPPAGRIPPVPAPR